MCFHGFHRAQSQTVVMTKHIVEIVYSYAQKRIHGIIAALFFPITRRTGYYRDVGILLYGIYKASMSLYHWRWPLHTGYLYHIATALHLSCHIPTHGVAHLVIVAAYKCREAIALYLPIECYNWYSSFHHLLHHRSDFIARYRCHYYHIHSVVGKLKQLALLQVDIIIGVSKPKLHIIIKISGCLQFGIEFLSPWVLTALRHAYHIFIFFAAARCHYAHYDKNYYAR